MINDSSWGSARLGSARMRNAFTEAWFEFQAVSYSSLHFQLACNAAGVLQASPISVVRAAGSFDGGHGCNAAFSLRLASGASFSWLETTFRLNQCY